MNRDFGDVLETGRGGSDYTVEGASARRSPPRSVSSSGSSTGSGMRARTVQAARGGLVYKAGFASPHFTLGNKKEEKERWR